MRISLAVPDSGPLGADLLAEIRAETGVTGVRVDVHPDDTDRNWRQVESLAAAPWCRPIFLLAPGKMRRSDGNPWTEEGLVDHTADMGKKLEACGLLERAVVEIGNEPDLADELWRQRPRALAEAFCRCYSELRRFSREMPILCPSISNLIFGRLRGFDYLREMLNAGLPADCGIAFHRYPPTQYFTSASAGFTTRFHEIEKLKNMVAGRKLWCTETGWAEVQRDYQLTEAEVAERTAKEIGFWASQEIESLTIYQLNSAELLGSDNADAKREKTFGLRRADGTWKPAALAMKQAIEALA